MGSDIFIYIFWEGGGREREGKGIGCRDREA